MLRGSGTDAFAMVFLLGIFTWYFYSSSFLVMHYVSAPLALLSLSLLPKLPKRNI